MPLRDGKNLIAKEYLAAQNPTTRDPDQISEALHQGLTMTLDEHRSRYAPMLQTLRINTISAWKDLFLMELGAVERPAPMHIAASR